MKDPMLPLRRLARRFRLSPRTRAVVSVGVFGVLIFSVLQLALQFHVMPDANPQLDRHLTQETAAPDGQPQLADTDTRPVGTSFIVWQILIAFLTGTLSALFYERTRQREKLATRLRYERNFALFSNTLVLDRPDAIHHCLPYILDATQCSRVYIFQNYLDTDGRLAMRQTHEACAEGACSQLDNPALQHIVYAEDGFARWEYELARDHMINGVVATFPESERAVLEPQSILSILVIPIWVGKEWGGFVGYDETRQAKQWSADDLNLLRAASQSLGMYLDRKQTEAALKASEEEFRIAFEHANDGICIVDLAGNFSRVNQRMCDLLGYSQTEFTTMSVHDIAHPGDKDLSGHFIERSLAGTTTTGVFEKRYICKDGRTIWGRVSSALAHDQQGKPLHFISHLQDITPVKELVDALTTSESRYRLLADHAADAIWTMDEHQNYTFVSPAFKRLYGYTLKELGKGLPEKLIPAHSRQVIMGHVKKRLASIRAGIPDRSAYRIEVEMQAKDGRRIWVESITTPVFDEQDHYRGVVGVSRDITDRKRAEDALKAGEEKMRLLATLDDLTKLANRRYFLELVKRELDRSHRYSHPFSLIMFDVDHFKHINDTRGHDAGDGVLMALSATVTGTLRVADLCGRFGGEEFVAGLPETGLDEALEVAERLRVVVENTEIELDSGELLRVTVSLGVAELSDASPDLTALLKHADLAMYAAKRNGRNRIEPYTPGMALTEAF
ncbi:PAS domain S-box protein [Thiorhodovibrio frisius]|uniref:PAS domain S-box/diguanylate cyclase (GGDEF) domain-containing protein n=1 Tax=Thiorhodovibrio frisius TaxID=631362 RepID=H8Z4J6_9GAMM|nr:PAS domain S-box protein [Thiorhodovibrio frisius]EIC20253.1 PAS domain S-box/diguanylate cyclase (GGDEF) domain-containing protein [Thiorhodovibrio frisius]WPL20990.1 Diguanylate cyclase DosC [Thiorhodovibrio frisius]